MNFTLRRYLISITFLCCLLGLYVRTDRIGTFYNATEKTFSVWLEFKEPLFGFRSIDYYNQRKAGGLIIQYKGKLYEQYNP